MSQMTLSLLLSATLATLYMVFLSGFIATLLGFPLGILLYVTRKGNFMEHSHGYQLLNFAINMMRSIPFIILMIAVIPFTRLIIGTSIGINAAVVPLSLAAIPFVARVTENALLEVNKGLIEAAISMGASPWQIIKKVLIPEALPGMINGLTLTMISLVGFSAMAGVVGGGGLGDIAIRYGYQRFDTQMMMVTILIMIALVQIVQWVGDRVAKRFTHR